MIARIVGEVISQLLCRERQVDRIDHVLARNRVHVALTPDRIAGDLHDLVIQRLFATGMSLQGATALLRDPEAASRVERAVDALDETIKDIRSAIFALQSRGAAEHPAVRGRILSVIEEMTGPLGYPPGLRMAGQLDARVPGPIAEHMLAALREALANVAKHAHATRADVAVEAGADLALRVSRSRTSRPAGPQGKWRFCRCAAAAGYRPVPVCGLAATLSCRGTLSSHGSRRS